MDTISTHVSSCLRAFKSLAALVTKNDIPGQTSPDARLIEDGWGRFKIWSANIGAHHDDRRSLDHRLRDASNIRNQVIRLLEHLGKILDDGVDYFQGRNTSEDIHDSLGAPEGASAKDENDLVSALESREIDEFPQIIDSINEVINCLFRLSVSIRNPAPRDLFMKSAATETSHFEEFDISHVRSKFARADNNVIERLGKAISRRRQYFKYRELHHEKLAQGIDSAESQDEGQSTVSSSIPQNLKTTHPKTVVQGHDFDDNGSLTTYAPSSMDPEQLRILPLPKDAHKGPFECPLCFTMVEIASHDSWK
ncbi:hypothetical protein PT974_01770 [Cladobotryum mycophilum]|uniref:Oxidoreductase acuF-like C2H2 type zinc-finger domain-containing protein n=1 Tax=Cladobotryum mycophilum TaxID=491253 RepID=A0ABR0SXE0_9HYPO